MKRIVEACNVFQALAPVVPSSASPQYVSLKYFNHVTVIINVSNTVTGGTASAITLKQATAQAGTGEKALAFDTVWANTNTGGGDIATKTTVTNNTFNTASGSSATCQYVIEVNADQLDVTNGFCFFRVGVGNAAEAIVSVNYILGEARFPQETPVSPS